MDIPNKSYGDAAIAFIGATIIALLLWYGCDYPEFWRILTESRWTAPHTLIEFLVIPPAVFLAAVPLIIAYFYVFAFAVAVRWYLYKRWRRESVVMQPESGRE